jgi:hypothetical protein
MQVHTTTAGRIHMVQIPLLQTPYIKNVASCSAPLKYSASKTFVPFGSSLEAVSAAVAVAMVPLDSFNEIDENIVDACPPYQAQQYLVQNERKFDPKYLILA